MNQEENPILSGGAGHSRYEHAPIIEASITIDIQQALPIDRYGVLGLLGAALQPDYPVAKVLSEFTGQDESSAGMVYFSADSKHVVQARSDGFTFSREAPYDRWDTFIQEARRTWNIYRSTVGDIPLRRISLKYINSISIPLLIPLRQIFNTYPLLPQPDQLLSSLQMHYKYDSPDLAGCQVSVLMVYLGSEPENPKATHVNSQFSIRGRMLLDNTLEYGVHDESALWDTLPKLRQIKNQLFESQITDILRTEFSNG